MRPKRRKIQKIIDRATRLGLVKNGVVICENDDTPASKTVCLSHGSILCAPCAWGEANAFDQGDLILVTPKDEEGKENARATKG